MKKILITTIAAASLLIFHVDNLSADAAPKIPSGWYLPIGINIGYSIQQNDQNGFIIGPEISIVHYSGGIWLGLYTDSIWDLGSDTYRFNIGTEFGIGPFGLELGYLYEYQGDMHNHGTRLGFIISFGVVSYYCRWGHFYNDINDNNIIEIGFLFKIPIELDTEPYRHYSPRPEQVE